MHQGKTISVGIPAILSLDLILMSKIVFLNMGLNVTSIYLVILFQYLTSVWN